MIKLDGSKKKAYALYGLLLGGGYVNPKKGSKIHYSTTNEQRGFIRMLAQFCSKNNIMFATEFDYPVKTEYGEYIYSSISIQVPRAILAQHFIKYNRFFNSDGKKTITEYTLRRISPLGLLFWFLSNGCLSVYNKKNDTTIIRQATLATQKFSFEENLKIQKMFLERFAIETKVHRDRKYFKQYFSAISFRKFYDVVRPYLGFIPKELQYKFNMKYIANQDVPESIYLCNNYNLGEQQHQYIQVNGSAIQPSKEVEDII